MFFRLAGLSLLIHLTIIMVASLVNLVRRRKLQSAFQTYHKSGGLVHSKFANQLISLSILAFVFTYIGSMMILAIKTGLEMGASEPQVIFVKSLFSSILGWIVTFITHPIGILSIFVFISAMLEYKTKHYLVFSNYFKNIRMTEQLSKKKQLLLRAFPVAEIASITLRIFIGAIIGAALFSVPLLAGAQIVEPGFQSEIVASGLTLATAAAFTPDGRIFIAEKGGTVKVVKNGVLLSQPLITLTDINTFGDRGLLGIAVDPNFASNGHVYLSYTYENSPGANVAAPKNGKIVRITVNGDTASESTKLVLVGTQSGTAALPSCEDYPVSNDCIPSDSNSHSVGGLTFGPDGKLYASLGDGADFAAVDSRALRAQNIDSLGGKVLRINTDGTAPSDNPFFNGDPDSNRSKVYAYGFRNMFRIHFDENTGKLYGGDVGWSTWEEINEIVAGGNYGWPCREGAAAQPQYNCAISGPGTSTDPLYAYLHNASGAGSITAGAFFTNGVYPTQYETSMFIGDYAQMWMKRLVLDTNGDFVSVEDFVLDNIWPVDIVTGTDGNVYYIDIATGNLMRITHTNGNRRPVINMSANPTSGLTPLTVDFSAAGTVDPDGDALTYSWAFGDGTTGTGSTTSHTYTTNGSYSVILIVTDALGATAAQSIDITVGDQAPTAVINSPASGSFYSPLQNVMVMGDATDPEDGTLPAGAFEWTVILHHNTHTHTSQQFSGTKMITFVADDHNDPTVYMEIELKVTDSAGLIDTTSINMYIDNSTAGANLVPNPSLEIAGTPSSTPQDWIQSWFGVIDPVFTYPVQGLSGNSAAQITVNSQTSGNAKWYFSPQYVNEGEDYHFSNLYKSDTTTYLTAQYGRSDGTYFYEQLAALPPVVDPTTTSATFTVPVGAETVTIFHDIDSVGTLIVDEYSLMLVASTTDTTPPTGTITNYVDGDVLSGTVTVNVDAQDDTGVVKMHLYVDGAKFPGIEDLAAPWDLVWDTTQVTNGTHTIMAHIHDTVDNHGLSPMVTVVVNNPTSTASSTNLVYNGDLETVDGQGNPTGWTVSSWGTHTAVHTYPVQGRNGGNAAEVQITQYDFTDNGDSKWFFNDIPVTEGTQYTFEDYYKSDTISDVIGRYTFADNSVSYFGIVKEIQPTATWTKVSNTFVPPTGVQSVTFFHLISSVGTLAIDDVAVFTTGTGTPSEINPPVVNFVNPLAGATASGTVTLEATATDDTSVVGVYFAVNGNPQGVEDFTAPYQTTWDTTLVPDGQYVLKATAHDPYGNNSKDEITVTVDNSSTPPPTSTSTNLILNPDFELVAGNGDPQYWKRGGWGTNNRTFTYPIAGVTGNAAEVAITSYTSGDAKWYFDDVTVLPSTEYTVGNSYNSNRASEALIRYTLSGGGTQYQFLRALPSTGGTWQTLSETITTPANANSLTLFHVIAGVGQLTVDDYSLTTVSTTTTDVTPPTSSITFPTDLSTTSGSINVAVSATDASGISSVELYLDGALYGATTVQPYTFAWDTTTATDGTHTLFARVTDNAGNTADSAQVTVTVDNTTSTPDVTDPAVAITSPTANQTINGSTPVTIAASDTESGLQDVWLYIDNQIVANFGPTGPFTYVWDTTTETDGNHTLRARATDMAGNLAQTSFVTVTVDNSTPPPTNNLVFNGDFEQLDGTGAPLGWTEGGYGTNSNTYAIATTTGGNVAYVDIYNYVSGDAKWVFDAVPVTAGDTYRYTVDYASLNNNEVVAFYTLTDGSTRAELLGYGPAYDSADPTDLTTYTIDFDIPNDAVTATVFYTPLVVDVNVLSYSYIDNVSLEHVSSNNGSNLILNPSLETPGTNPSIPEFWSQSVSGNLDATFTYPVAGSVGSAARIDVANYVSGDAKWVFSPVALTPGQLYTITHDYRSDVETTITMQYERSDGTFYYVGRVDLPPGQNWKTFTDAFVVPTDAVSVSVFHSLTSDGYLEIDEYLLEVGTSEGFANGKLSLTFDDGWFTHYTEALPLLEANDIDATFYITTDEVLAATASELVPNNDLTTAGTGGDPQNWHRGGWGVNTPTYTYPDTGITGNEAVTVELTQHTSGDVKWYFDDVPVTAGETYAITQTYRSTVNTEVVMRYTLADSSVQYAFVEGVPSTNNTWTVYSNTVVAPTNAVSATVFHVIGGVGLISIDDASMTQVENYSSPELVGRISQAGHEIAAHTKTHPYLTTLNQTNQVNEISGSKTDLENTIVPGITVTNLAYPFGDYDASVVANTQAAGYAGARSVDRGYNTKATDKYALKIQSVNRTTTIAEVQNWIAQAEQDNTWLIFMFHQIDDIPANTLGVTPEFLQQILAEVNSSGIEVQTVGNVIPQMN